MCGGSVVAGLPRIMSNKTNLKCPKCGSTKCWVAVAKQLVRYKVMSKLSNLELPSAIIGEAIPQQEERYIIVE